MVVCKRIVKKGEKEGKRTSKRENVFDFIEKNTLFNKKSFAYRLYFYSSIFLFLAATTIRTPMTR